MKYKPDLEFNQAMHYTISIEDSTLFDLASQDTLRLGEQVKVNVLLNETPESLLPNNAGRLLGDENNSADRID